MERPKQITMLVLPRESVGKDLVASNELFAEYIAAILEETGKLDVIVAHAEDYILNLQPQEDAGASSDQDQS